jgi:acyl carrier protein
VISEEKLKTVMASVLQVGALTIDENTSSDTVEHWDSLKQMNLILALEEEFKVSIPDEDVPNLTSYKLIRVVLNELTMAN